MNADVTLADEGAFPTLDENDLETLRRFGRVQSVQLGRVLQREGDIPRDFYVVVSGSIDVVVRIAGREQVLRRHERGAFLGELSLLTGQRSYIEARVTGAGELIVVPHEAFRRMIATEPELSDIILRAFVGRRRAMISMPASPLRILGSTFSPESLRLREFAVRNSLVHQWIDVETAPEAAAIIEQLGLAPLDLPVVLLADEAPLRGATPAACASLDRAGFIRTDRALDGRALDTRWDLLGREPLPFETGHPGLFAVGDVRSGSVKRVAAAVGEGSAAVRSVHEHLSYAH